MVTSLSCEAWQGQRPHRLRFFVSILCSSLDSNPENEKMNCLDVLSFDRKALVCSTMLITDEAQRPARLGSQNDRIDNE